MLPIIQSGAQLRINGNHKFKEGKFREALMMYLQGCVGFELYCATNEQDQQLLDDVHVQARPRLRTLVGRLRTLVGRLRAGAVSRSIAACRSASRRLAQPPTFS